MPQQLATIVYAAVILGLFWLDRDQKAHTSKALWIPILWLSLAASRSVSQWLQSGPRVEGYDLYIEGNPLDRLVYGGLLVVGIIVLISRMRQVSQILRANLPIVLFFLYCALSMLWSDYPDVAFKRWNKAIGDFVMVLIVLTDPDPRSALKRFLARTTYLLIPLSVLLIKYYPDLAKMYGQWDYKGYYTGVTTNKNTLGVICLLFGLGSVWRLLAAYKDREGTGRSRRLIAHGVILGMVVWLFWMANSMTALGCFLLASTLLLVTNSRVALRRPAVVHILVIVMVSVSAAVLFIGLAPGVLEAMGRDPTLTDRTAIWALILSMPENPLLGTGFESFWLGPRLARIWSAYSWGPAEAHNGYIEIFLQLGWAGVALLAVVIYTGYRTVIAVFRRDPATSSLMLAFFVIGLIYNFTEAAFFRMMAPAWIFFLLAIIRVPEFPPLKAQVISGCPKQSHKVPAEGERYDSNRR